MKEATAARSRRAPLAGLPAAGRWIVLLAASSGATAVLAEAGLPAALLLGPLLAAIAVQSVGGGVRLPRFLLLLAQAVIGCLVARAITPAIVAGFASHWPVFVFAVTSSLLAAIAIGWSMARSRILPGTTPVWGMLPGAATAMMVMAEAYGADARLVAFMQYLRVVAVAAAASIVALLFVHGGAHRFAGGYFSPVDPGRLAATLSVMAAGGALGTALRFPAGALMGPLALGAVLNVLGLVRFELPPILLVGSYALIGWNTGLRFTPDVLVAASRALPQTIGATGLLMGFCGLLAWVLTVVLHVDPLTAYLATSPGGVDSAAIIAASTKVDVPFVMTLQTVRVVVVLVFGPGLARRVAGRLDRRSAGRAANGPSDPGGPD